MAFFRFLNERLNVFPAVVATGFLVAGSLVAQTTISPEGRRAYAANAGWIDARPSEANGARVNEHVCSGYLYSANLGWIHLGSGAPTDGFSYNQTSATNYGVNVTTSSIFGDVPGRLNGFAYGANIGWIVFAPVGNPRVDLQTGRLSGHAYSANVGWINLGEFSVSVATKIAPGVDGDSDGIPDHWEIAWFGPLGVAGADTDFDGDGVSDYEEYLADTNPLDANDRLRITDFAFDTAVAPIAAAVSFTSRSSRRYRVEFIGDLGLSPAGWQDSGLGLFAPDSGDETSRAFGTLEGPRVFVRVRAERPLAP